MLDTILTSPFFGLALSAAAATPWMPPWLSAMPRAMAVVTLLGRREAVSTSSSWNRRHSASTLPRLARVPARHPARTGRKYSVRTARWW